MTSREYVNSLMDVGLRAQRSGSWRVADESWLHLALPLIEDGGIQLRVGDQRELRYYERKGKAPVFAVRVGAREFRIPEEVVPTEHWAALRATASRMTLTVCDRSARRKLLRPERGTDFALLLHQVVEGRNGAAASAAAL